MERPNKKSLSVFVTGLCGLFKKKDLQEYLRSECTGVKSVYLPNKRKAGYAFVEAKDKKSLEKLLKLKHLSFNGRELMIKRFLTGQKLQKFKKEVNSRRIFVHSVPPSWKDEDLRELFGGFGAIEDAFVIRDRNTGRSKCFGYAIFIEKPIAEDVANMGCIKFKGSVVKVKMHERNQNANKRRSGKKNACSKRNGKKKEKAMAACEKKKSDTKKTGNVENPKKTGSKGNCKKSRHVSKRKIAKKKSIEPSRESDNQAQSGKIGQTDAHQKKDPTFASKDEKIQLHKPVKMAHDSCALEKHSPLLIPNNLHQSIDNEDHWARPTTRFYYDARTQIKDIQIQSRSAQYRQNPPSNPNLGIRKIRHRNFYSGAQGWLIDF